MRVLVSGYNGHMGQVLAQMIKEDSELELVCGVDKIINCEGKFLNCSNLESIDYFEVNDKNSSIY